MIQDDNLFFISSGSISRASSRKASDILGIPASDVVSIQSEIITTVETSADKEEPNLILHVPKDDSPPEKRNRTCFWLTMIVLGGVLAIGAGIGKIRGHFF